MLVFANIFQPLIDLFEAIIKFFHNSVGVPWGWAIVLLTVCTRALLIPLAVKQYHSMQRLQAHMPELKKIQQKYKDDKQRQQQEMAKFYKENQVNPFGSCAPMVAQIPVFISLYYMLRSQLRRDICPELQTHHIVNGHLVIGTSKACGSHGASFLFIHDLTTNATGGTLIVLMALYVGTMLASSLLLSPPNIERQQRIMMIVLPLFLSFIVIRFPTGVLVYWITTNLWTMVQQYVIRARLGPTPAMAAATAEAASNGAPAPKAPSPASSPPARPSLMGRLRGEEPQDGAEVKPRERAGAPPPPPRKRKKRSGRRR